MTLLLGLAAGFLFFACLSLASRLRTAQRRIGQERRERMEAELRLAAARSARLGVIDAVAHELRTPLAAILGHQELLAEGLYGPLGERAHGAVVRVGYASHQLLHLIDGVLDLARVELGALEVQVSDVDSRTLIEDAVRYARSQAGDRGAEMGVELPDEWPLLRTDERKAERVLHLAITGAVRASGAAPLSLSVAWQPGPMLVFTIAGTALDPDAAPLAAEDAGTALDELRRALPGGEPTNGAHPGAAGGGLEAAQPRRSWMRLTIARVLARRLGGDLRVEAEGEPAGPPRARVVIRIRSLPQPARPRPRD